MLLFPFFCALWDCSGVANAPLSPRGWPLSTKSVNIESLHIMGMAKFVNTKKYLDNEAFFQKIMSGRSFHR